MGTKLSACRAVVRLAAVRPTFFPDPLLFQRCPADVARHGSKSSITVKYGLGIIFGYILCIGGWRDSAMARCKRNAHWTHWKIKVRIHASRCSGSQQRCSKTWAPSCQPVGPSCGWRRHVQLFFPTPTFPTLFSRCRQTW